MPSKAHGNGDNTASALAAAGLVASIAREAVDGVPVIKQIVGVVARIITLAERIDKDRDALHALAEKSLELARIIQNALQGRSVDDTVKNSLDNIHRVLKAVEQLMSSHIAKNRLRRAMGYAFTVAPKVERISRELSDALQEFNIVALLDTNLHVRTVNQTVEENARYDGEFRLLRHCDVEKGDLFLKQSSKDGTLDVKYHRADVDGRVLAVRYFAAAAPTSSTGSGPVDAEGSELYTRIISHERLLVDISTVQKSHSHVARVYGWSRGSPRSRFMVLKSGFASARAHFEDLNLKKKIEPAEILSFTFKLLDASRHLATIGVQWMPKRSSQTSVLLDQHGEPTIGLDDDLGICDDDPWDAYRGQLMTIFWNYFLLGFMEPPWSPESFFPTAYARDQRIDRLINGREDGKMWTQHRVLSKSVLPNQLLNGCANAEYLTRVAEADISGVLCGIYPWVQMCALLPRATCKSLCSTLYATCEAQARYATIRRCVSVMEMFEDESGVVFIHRRIAFPALRLQEIMDLCGIADAMVRPLLRYEMVFHHLFTTSYVPSGVPGTASYKPIPRSDVRS